MFFQPQNCIYGKFDCTIVSITAASSTTLLGSPFGWNKIFDPSNLLYLGDGTSEFSIPGAYKYIEANLVAKEPIRGTDAGITYSSRINVGLNITSTGPTYSILFDTWIPTSTAISGFARYYSTQMSYPITNSDQNPFTFRIGASTPVGAPYNYNSIDFELYIAAYQ